MRKYKVQPISEEGAAKALEGMQEFYHLRLVLDPDGGIQGAGVYNGEALGEAHERCAMVAQLVARSIPQLVEAAESYLQLRHMLVDALEDARDKFDNKDEESDDNKANASTGDQDADTILNRGNLKQHGTIIH